MKVLKLIDKFFIKINNRLSFTLIVCGLMLNSLNLNGLTFIVSGYILLIMGYQYKKKEKIK